MTNYSTGHDAEKRAASYLQAHGYEIIQLNWKTKYCEIDIVSKKDKCIVFVEVKYREDDEQGKGFDYITPKKLRQMSMAAEMWVEDNDWDGDYYLAAIEMNAADEINFVEIDS